MSARDFYRHCYDDQVAGAPGPEHEATFAARVGCALAAIGRPSSVVLDYGCGTGAASTKLAAAGHRVIGVDVSDSGLALARHTAADVAFAQVGTESRLPFVSGVFDVCLCTEVIEHLLDVQGFMREVHRVLRPRGQFLITVPYHGLLKNLAVIALNFDRHFDVTGGHVRFFTRTSLTHCLAANGFTVERFAGIGRFPCMWKSMFVAARKR